MSCHSHAMSYMNCNKISGQSQKCHGRPRCPELKNVAYVTPKNSSHKGNQISIDHGALFWEMGNAKKIGRTIDTNHQCIV